MKGKKRLERLHPRLRNVYKALRAAEKKIGAPPSVREIVLELGLPAVTHTSRVHGDIEKLVRMGYVKKLDIPTRCFRAVGPPPDEIDWEAEILAY